MLGLTKGDGTNKFVDEIIQEGVKAGTIAPADVPKMRVQMRNEIVRQQDVLAAEVALAQVKASGALTPALLDDFRKKTGLNDDWLRARGYIDARGNLIGYVDPAAAPRAASQAAALAASQEAVQNAPPARPVAPRGLPRKPMTHDGLPARQNADGSISTEVSITVTDPRLNGGRPTNIPSLWGGKEVDEDTAVRLALQSGNRYQAFGTVDEAVAAARARSQAGGAGAR